MRPFQRISGIQWVACGGLLLIAGQANAQSHAGGFTDRLPARMDLEHFLGHEGQRRLASTRAWSVTADSGTSSFTLRAARTRSPRPLDGGVPDRLDRFAVYETSFTAQTDLSPDLTLSGTGTLAIMNRRMQLIDIGAGRSRQSIMASAGLAIMQEGRNRIAFDYVYSAPTSARTPLIRMSELLGGAPIAASGFRLSLSQPIDLAHRAALEWRIAASAMNRADQDAELLGAPPGIIDHSVIARLRATF